MRRLSLAAARRLALGAQGFCDPRPASRVDVRHLRRVLGRMAVLQLDSVNAVCRSHYLPVFARLGPYDRERLDQWLWRSGENTEHLAHEASVIPVESLPLFRFRAREGRWSAGPRLAAERPDYIEAVRAEVAERGPLAVGDLSDPGGRSGPWWGWSPGKVALEWLYATGRLAIHHRDLSFVTHYDLPERVIPASVLNQPDLDPDEAHRRLLMLAARAQGVGTDKDLADHFRLGLSRCRPLLAQLAASGQLERVEVQGWAEPAYLDPAAVRPRRVEARALLSPFDPLVWFRPRAERLFGFHYRIEIYVPRAKRRYGYYVLPFLLGDRLVARVDVRADRERRVLEVPGAFAEVDHDPGQIAGPLATSLTELAHWLGLDGVELGERGDLAGPLAPELARSA